MKQTTSLFKHASGIGLLGILLFITCLFWRVTITDPAVDELHTMLLKLTFPGFQGLDAASILWGMVLSFTYGFLASAVFHLVHPDCCGTKR